MNGVQPAAGDVQGERNVEIALAYLAAISSGAPDETVLGFFADDMMQTEYPNRIADEGATRNLEELRAAAAYGNKLLRSQRYLVRHAMAQGEMVFIETLWEGILATRAGELQAGDTLRAHCAMVLELRDGKIVQQRNYDCFEPLRDPLRRVATPNT